MCVHQSWLTKNIEMNVYRILMLMFAMQYCYNHKMNTRTKRLTIKKPSREIESHTSIFLEGELYSLAPVSRYPNNRTKLLRKNNHASSKGSKVGQWHDSLVKKPSLKLSMEKDTESDLEVIRPGKHALRNKSFRGKKKINHFKKRLNTRNFTDSKKNYFKTPQQSVLGKAHRFAYTPSLSSAQNDTFVDEMTKDILRTPNYSDQNISSSSSFQLYQSSDQVENISNPSIETSISDQSASIGSLSNLNQTSDQINWENTNSPSVGTSETALTKDQKSPYSKRDIFPSYSDAQGDGDSWLTNGNVIEIYRNNIRSPGEFVRPFERTAEPWMKTLSPAFIQRAPINQQNLPVTLPQPRSEQEAGAKSDEAESGDTEISFGVTCDQIINQTCWMQREVGDVLTLSVKIESSKRSNLFQVRWTKDYQVYGGKKKKPLEVETGKLPWNMVIGSEGRELRLNPVTNTDMDPNCIIAKVFSLANHRGKTLFTQLKKVVFHIDSPIIDMGKLYAGEELTINIENFISLPERGNLLFDWCLETSPHQYKALPSNFKVSSSGRSLVLKELKKGRVGVLNCVIYSSNRFAVAKRRFNILKVEESVKRRSVVTNFERRAAAADLKRSRRCRHVIRRSQEMAIQRLEEGTKPKSRKKRFKRMNSDIHEQAHKDCEFLRKKVYSRFVRSLFKESITEDPRIMPLERLFELSEGGDGTLDDLIPHEVHYVAPQVRLLPGTALDKSHQLPSSANCTTNSDCGKYATCVRFKGKQNSTDELGYCNCRPEFYGDGFLCRKIPISIHREKRLRRNAGKDFVVPKHLFYERSKEVNSITTTEFAEEDEGSEGPPKVLAFEEEESFLLSDCIDDKDCSSHASCIQPNNGHPYCKCRPGFRGSGVFCWETMDYVPPDETVEDIDPTDLRDPVRDPLEATVPVSDELQDQ